MSFSEKRLSGRLGVQMGFSVACLESQTHRLALGAASRVELFWMALALGQLSAFEALASREILRAQSHGRLASMWL